MTKIIQFPKAKILQFPARPEQQRQYFAIENRLELMVQQAQTEVNACLLYVLNLMYNDIPLTDSCLRQISSLVREIRNTVDCLANDQAERHV